MQQSRVYRTVMSKTHRHYDLLEGFCHESKNLWNYANYLLRGKYRAKDYELFNFYKLRKHIQSDPDPGNPWHRQASAHIGAETLRVLCNSWQAYFASVKSFSRFPEKFKAYPKQPGYLKKDGCFQMVLDAGTFKHKGNDIGFPKSFNKLLIPFGKADRAQQVRVVPQHNHINIEIVYRVDVPDIIADNGRYLGIDLGVSNFAAIASNAEGFQSLVVNGKGLKSINQLYNKNKAYYQELADRLGQGKATNRIADITWKRNQRVNDFMHKASRYVAELAKANNICHVVCGYNADWKGGINHGKKNNQNFVQIPYLKFVSLLRYKLADCGIGLTLVEEPYTSKTSFLDGEYPEKRERYAGRRRHRGLFVSSDKTKINADVNAAYQMVKKVFPDAYANGIGGVSLHPVMVNVANL